MAVARDAIAAAPQAEILSLAGALLNSMPNPLQPEVRAGTRRAACGTAGPLLTARPAASHSSSQSRQQFRVPALYVPADTIALKKLAESCKTREAVCPDLRSKLDSFLVREYAAVWSWRGAVTPGEDAMHLIVSQLWLLGGASVTPLLEPSTSVRLWNAPTLTLLRPCVPRPRCVRRRRAAPSFLHPLTPRLSSNRPQMFLSDAPAAVRCKKKKRKKRERSVL
jgi:hypothetical protein